MAMVSMAMDKKMAKDMATMPGESDAKNMPKYPYGLNLHLNKECLMKLGISGVPAFGQKFQLVAIVEVTSARSEEMQEGTDVNADMQITDMQLTPAAKDAAPVMFASEEH